MTVKEFIDGIRNGPTPYALDPVELTTLVALHRVALSVGNSDIMTEIEDFLEDINYHRYNIMLDDGSYLEIFEELWDELKGET